MEMFFFITIIIIISCAKKQAIRSKLITKRCYIAHFKEQNPASDRPRSISISPPLPRNLADFHAGLTCEFLAARLLNKNQGFLRYGKSAI